MMYSFSGVDWFEEKLVLFFLVCPPAPLLIDGHPALHLRSWSGGREKNRLTSTKKMAGGNWEKNTIESSMG